MQVRVMRVRVMVGVLLCMVGVGMMRAQKPELQAQTVNLEWLMAMDTGRYGEAWDAAAATLKQAVTREEWVEKMTAVRGPLGKVVSRELANSTYSKTLPGVPVGDYVLTQYRTKFAGKDDGAETVVTSREKDGVWRVAGYYFK